MKKLDRIKMIEELLSDQDIKTQEELVQALEDKKIDVTQATVSRDIKEMGLVKVPAKSGGYRYNLPNLSGNQTLTALVRDIKLMDKMVAIKTSPGHAMLLKRKINSLCEERIFSLISDDDSILLVANSDEDARITYRFLGGE
ncbi:ArgR family transcriptional regulator [Streptococcaceae bacterium ESL0729]|nr:ArgR family transcriptional regulator [Streptococcaceae bacterium ESL0729]